MCGIYCIENLSNNKKYIGQSTHIEQRWEEHKRYLKENKHHNEHLQNAWNTYGESSFNFYVLQECEINELDETEVYYIRLFNSTSRKNGYNIDSGGKANKIVSEETKIKQKNAKIGKALSETHRRKIGDSLKGHKPYAKTVDGIKSLHDFNVGKKLSEGTKEKISKTLSGKLKSEETKRKMSQNHANKRPIFCPQLNEVFLCVNDAEDKYNISHQNIIKCLNGERKSAGKHPVTGEKLTWEDIKQ